MKPLIIGLLLIIVICSCVYMSTKFSNTIKEGIDNAESGSNSSVTQYAKSADTKWFGWEFEINVNAWSKGDYVIFQIGDKQIIKTIPTTDTFPYVFSFTDTPFLSPNTTGYETYPFKIYSTQDIYDIKFKLISPLYLNTNIINGNQVVNKCTPNNANCKLNLGWTTINNPTSTNANPPPEQVCDASWCNFADSWISMKYLLGGYIVDGSNSNIDTGCYAYNPPHSSDASTTSPTPSFDNHAENCYNSCNDKIAFCGKSKANINNPYEWGVAWTQSCLNQIQDTAISPGRDCTANAVVSITQYIMGTGNMPGSAITESDVSGAYIDNLNTYCVAKDPLCDIELSKTNDTSDTSSIIKNLYTQYQQQLFLKLIPSRYTGYGSTPVNGVPMSYPDFETYYTDPTHNAEFTQLANTYTKDATNFYSEVLPMERPLDTTNNRTKYFNFFKGKTKIIQVDDLKKYNDNNIFGLIDNGFNRKLGLTGLEKSGGVLLIEGILNLNENVIRSLAYIKPSIGLPYTNLYNTNTTHPIYPTWWKDCFKSSKAALNGQNPCDFLSNSSIVPGPYKEKLNQPVQPDWPVDKKYVYSPPIYPSANPVSANEVQGQIVDDMKKQRDDQIEAAKQNPVVLPPPPPPPTNYNYKPIDVTPTDNTPVAPLDRDFTNIQRMRNPDGSKPIQPNLPTNEILGLSEQSYYREPTPYIAYTNIVPIDKDNINYDKYNDNIIQPYVVPSNAKKNIPGIFSGIGM